MNFQNSCICFDHWQLGLTTIKNVDNLKNKRRRSLWAIVDDVCKMVLLVCFISFVQVKEAITTPPQRTLLQHLPHRYFRNISQVLDVNLLFPNVCQV